MLQGGGREEGGDICHYKVMVHAITVDFHSLRIVRFRIPAPAVVTDSPLTFNSRCQIQKVI